MCSFSLFKRITIIISFVLVPFLKIFGMHVRRVRNRSYATDSGIGIKQFKWMITSTVRISKLEKFIKWFNSLNEQKKLSLI